MQMEGQTFIKTLKNILIKEGPHAFYKGVGGPLMSMPLVNSIIFCSYEISRKIFESNQKTDLYHSKHMSLD